MWGGKSTEHYLGAKGSEGLGLPWARYIYIYIYIYMYTYIYIYLSIYLSIYLYIYI